MADEFELTEGKLHAKRLGRELAMQFLFQCDLRGELPEMESWERFFEQMKEIYALHDNRFARKSREYAELLFTCIVPHLEEVDKVIAEHSANWDFERLSRVDRNIMRVAVYEMLFVADVPPVVSINEAVEIAIDYSGDRAGSFINGILNSIKNTLKRPAREATESL